MARVVWPTRPTRASTRNVIVNIGNAQSMAVRSRKHSPLVFDDPARFRRDGTADEQHVLAEAGQAHETSNATLEFLTTMARNATESSELVRQASATYRTPVDYGSGEDSASTFSESPRSSPPKCRRGCYVSYQGNAFDTHVQQADLHGRLLMYTADAVRGFLDDVKRIGRKDDVAVMLFTEFGRRVEENGSLGTDHGTATPMFVAGHGVKGGFYGTHPSLTDLDDGQHEDDDRFQAYVRIADPGMARLRRHTVGPQRPLRPNRDVRVKHTKCLCTHTA